MQNILLLKGFNNYYNRIIKKLDNYTDYYEYLVELKQNVNFNPSDGVNTNLVLNYAPDVSPDYLVVCDNNNEILSRWFILDATRKRSGQYELNLKRDLIADNYDTVINSPVYVEKAIINNNEDVAIYNKENYEFNQIKKSEELLKDKTKTAWVVGYYAPLNADKSITTSTIDYNIYGEYDSDADFFSSIGGNTYKYVTKLNNIHILFQLEPSVYFNNTGSIDLIENKTSVFAYDGLGNTNLKFTNVEAGYLNRLKFMSNVLHYLSNNSYDIKTALYNENEFKNLRPTFIDRIIKVGNDYKKVIVTETIRENYQINISKTSNTFSTIANLLEEEYDKFNTFGLTDYNGIYVKYNGIEYAITLETISNPSSISTQISQGANSLQDAPYKMFAIPLTTCLYIKNGLQYTKLDKNSTLSLSASIAKELGSYVYDVQLLPYCPMLEIWDDRAGYKRLSLGGLNEHVDYEFIKINEENVSFILYPKTSTFETIIEKSLTLNEDIIERKIENQCNLHRLCSPNYSAVFEFNLVKSGSIARFNVDCTYKPYNPYIHLNPEWSRLYGQDFNDTRGLICQGDFSLPIINDQWKQYQINNKNYLNSFNRNIESLEIQRKANIVQNISSIGFNAINSITSATLGNTATAFSQVSQAGNNILNSILQNELNKENINLQRDQFNYSLQNIQALPNTLAKVSSYDANNKLFPVLEFYTCTDYEKEIFKENMTYRGMTIGRIDKIINFINDNEKRYFRGILIRDTNIIEDFHMLNSLAEEIYKGIYI